MRRRQLVERRADVISLVDPAGKVLCASAASATILGYLPEELVARNTLDLIHPEDRSHSRRALLMVIARPASSRQFEARVRRKDGNWCWVETTLSNLLDENCVRAIVVNCRAIGARKEARDLEQRKLAELARSNAQLEDFTYAVSHDFKEHLRTISMFTSLLVKRTELDAQGSQLAQNITNGVRRMAALLEGLRALAVSRVVDPPRSFALSGVVAAVLEDLRHAITTSGATVTVEALPFVEGNEAHLTRVFQNLIGNAVKYRSERPAAISVSAEQWGSDWIIKVKDNGDGIPQEYHKSIFRVLKRLHGPEIPGTGLGLAICRTIVEAMGGAIWVESEPGAGSVFCFTIAAAKEAFVDSTILRTNNISHRPLSMDAETLVFSDVAARPALKVAASER